MDEAAALRLARARERGATAYATLVAGCAAAAAGFLAYAVTARRPHEDEVLALFVGRGSLGDVLSSVHERGGAPLHFLIAWAVVQLGGGLDALRAVSAALAVAAVPVTAALCSRLAGRTVAAAATPLLAASWMLLFYGTFARMYTLFLLASALSYLALLRAVERRSRGAWALWVLAATATSASHTYGLLVLASQALFLVAARPLPLRRTVVPFAVAAALAIPFWLDDAVLAGRYRLGLGGGGARLGRPWAVLRYLYETFGDFTAGWPWTDWPLLAVAACGVVALGRSRGRSAILVGSVVAAPAVVLVVARIGSTASPETRHLIFALPFGLLALAAGLVRLLRRPLLVAAAVAAIAVAEVAWGLHRTGELYRGEPAARVAAREAASRWLAATARPDDVLLGYDPLFLGAWEDGGDVSRTVVPRADQGLALATLHAAPKPLGRGVFVFDASDTGNVHKSLSIPLRLPPGGGFTGRVWGPFLVLETTAPTRTVRGYLERAVAAEAVGRSLHLADADVNYPTMREALASARQSP